MYQVKSTVRIAEFSGQWEGRTIDGAFPLRQLLGTGANSAVFLTTYETRPAAIKLLETEPQAADAQLARWRAASKLSHINLLRIFSTGRDELDGVPLLYIVTEYAEENLAQVLPDRALTALEARQMLEPALNALDYIHRQGFVHAHLKPANIMAVDDQLKLSIDGLRRSGESDVPSELSANDPPERAKGIVSPPGDVWSLGMTLIEVLTQRLPEAGVPPPDLPQPFAEIARHCLQTNPADRWAIPQISKYLAEPEAGVLPSRPESRKTRYVVPVGVLILLALVVITVAGVVIRRSDTETLPPAAPTVVAKTAEPQPQLAMKPEPEKPSTAAAAKEEAPKPEAKKEPEPKPAAAPEPANDAPASTIPATGDQPMPEIPSHARNTIRGRVKVNVKVDVDPSGKVTDAKLEPPPASKYFSELALKAVRQWKFEPVRVNGSDAAQRWRVRFEFQKSGTKAQRQRLSP